MNVQASIASMSKHIRLLAPVDAIESDADYFSRRAGEEQAAAARSMDALVRKVHEELAERYRLLSAAIREVDERIA